MWAMLQTPKFFIIQNPQDRFHSQDQSAPQKNLEFCEMKITTYVANWNKACTVPQQQNSHSPHVRKQKCQNLRNSLAECRNCRISSCSVKLYSVFVHRRSLKTRLRFCILSDTSKKQHRTGPHLLGWMRYTCSDMITRHSEWNSRLSFKTLPPRLTQ